MIHDQTPLVCCGINSNQHNFVKLWLQLRQYFATLWEIFRTTSSIWMHTLCYKIEIGPIVALLGRKHLGHLIETKVYLQRTKTKASKCT